MQKTDQGPRPIAHLGGNPAEFHRLLALIPMHFGEHWLLMQRQQHPVGILWERRDWLATNELVILASAIDWAQIIPGNWLNRQIKSIKDKDRNNRRGAMMELIAMHMLRNSGSGVAPTPKNTPGYDINVVMNEKERFLISVKDYGTSIHEKKFQSLSRKFELAFISRLRSCRKNGVCMIAISEIYPEAEDWQHLHDNLKSIIELPLSYSNVHVIGNWKVSLHPPPKDVLPIQQGVLSYQLIVLGRFHRNEVRNFESKLEDAAENAKKHARLDPNIMHSVFIRLPEWFKASTAQKWTQSFLNSHPAGPLGHIILYQPQVVRNGDVSQIQHSFNPAVSMHALDWSVRGNILQYEATVGVVSNSGTSFRLAGHGLPVDEHYIYQRGEFFTEPYRNKGGGFEVNIGCIAPGIIQKTLLRGIENNISINGKFPPNEEIVLFS